MSRPGAGNLSETPLETGRVAQSAWPGRLFRWGMLLLVVDLLIGGTIVGVQLRRWAWDYTSVARFRYDIGRNYNFGRQAITEGYFNVYENQLITNPPEHQKINYTPLRLALFAAWAKWNQTHVSNPEQWQEPHEFNAFLMYHNTALEWLGAIAAFLVVRHWILRTGPPPKLLGQQGRLDRLLTGSFRATLAFLILWFNPAIIASAHGWPSTDMWVVPYFLWAVLFACWEKWFIAGLVMGLGVMFKGQQLFTLPLFILWPLFAGQPGRALRWVSGIALMAAIIISGWMFTYPADADPKTLERVVDWHAVLWITCIALSVPLANCYRLIAQKGLARTITLILGAAAAAVLVFWPVYQQGTYLPVVLISLLTVLSAIFLSLKNQRYVLAATIAAGVFLCMLYFHGNTAWWKLGFVYGTERHPNLIVGPGSNLPALLGERFGWRSPTQTALTIDPATIFFWPAEAIHVELRQLLVAIYGFFFLISCIAIALAWKRNDRRFLIAITVPWFLMYAINAQMHERYLLYGSGVGAIIIGCSFGLSVLNWFLILLTALQTLNCMQFANGLIYRMDHPLLNADFNRFCEQIRPDIAWGVLVATAVLLFAALTSRKKRPPESIDEAPLADSNSSSN